jgi:hypothetical protein
MKRIPQIVTHDMETPHNQPSDLQVAQKTGFRHFQPELKWLAGWCAAPSAVPSVVSGRQIGA